MAYSLLLSKRKALKQLAHTFIPPKVLTVQKDSKNSYWLFAYGPNSSYTQATVIRAEEKDSAAQLGFKVAMRELEHRPGTHHIECIDIHPKSTGLYSILLPEAKAMIDTHWESRDAVCDHWETEINKKSKNPVKERQRGLRP